MAYEDDMTYHAALVVPFLVLSIISTAFTVCIPKIYHI